MSNWDLYQEAYHNCSAEIKEVLDSERIPKFAKKLVADNDLEDNTYPKLVSIISELLLNVIKKEDILDLIEKENVSSREKGLLLRREVEDFVLTLSEEVGNLYSPSEEGPKKAAGDLSEKSSPVFENKPKPEANTPTAPSPTPVDIPDQSPYENTPNPAQESVEKPEGESVYTSTQNALLYESRDTKPRSPSNLEDSDDDHRWDRS